MNYIISEKITGHKVRDMCIREELYTNGTIQEMYCLLDYCDNERPDAEILEIVAKNILEHSDVRNDREAIAAIMYLLLTECVTRYIMY